jgi:hypothetical protein
MVTGTRSLPMVSRRMKATIAAGFLTATLLLGTGGIVSHRGATSATGSVVVEASDGDFAAEAYSKGQLEAECRYEYEQWVKAKGSDKSKWKDLWDEGGCKGAYGNIDTITEKIVAPTPTPAKFAPPGPAAPRASTPTPTPYTHGPIAPPIAR